MFRRRVATWSVATLTVLLLAGCSAASAPPPPSATPTAPPSATPTATPTPPGLHVAGNELVDGSGTAVQLRGVNASGTEYACIHGWGIFDLPGAHGTEVPEAAVQRLVQWQGITAVRVPLNEQCWLGLGVDRQYGGAAYQRAVADFVAKLRAHGLVVVLDLHRTAPADGRSLQQEQMPDRDHSVDFWRQVATAYRDDTSVVFDLFNEPWPYSAHSGERAWSCWRDGGCRLPSQNTGESYTAAGMNELIAAVRSTGARNVLARGRPLLGRGARPLARVPAERPAEQPDGGVPRVCRQRHLHRGEVLRLRARPPLIAEVPLYVGEFGPEHHRRVRRPVPGQRRRAHRIRRAAARLARRARRQLDRLVVERLGRLLLAGAGPARHADTGLGRFVLDRLSPELTADQPGCPLTGRAGTCQAQEADHEGRQLAYSRSSSPFLQARAFPSSTYATGGGPSGLS